MFQMSDRWLNDKKGEEIYLEKYDRKQFDAPSVAVDLIVLSQDSSKILLITRAEHPFVNHLALPGGFYRPGDESLEAAASRELLEETSVPLQITEKDLVKVTSNKNRDPRGWVISVAYRVFVDEHAVRPIANSDAIRASWYELKDLKKDDLAFDHYDIIRYGMSR